VFDVTWVINFILRSAPKKENLRWTELESLCEIYLRHMYMVKVGALPSTKLVWRTSL
jgi:hypothetical protein